MVVLSENGEVANNDRFLREIAISPAAHHLGNFEFHGLEDRLHGVGANTLDGDGIFNREFKELLDAYGRPKAMEESEQDILERVRKGIGRASDAAQNAAATANAAKVETGRR